MAKGISVTACQVWLAKESKNNYLGMASVTLNDEFAVTGIRIMRGGKNGCFVAMPSRKGKDEQYYDVCFPVSKELRAEITEAVLSTAKAAKNSPDFHYNTAGDKKKATTPKDMPF